MWWPDSRSLHCLALHGLALRRVALRLAGVCAAGAMVAGCFQPLYGDTSFTASPSVAAAMTAVDINQIAAPNGTPLSRIAVEVRNKLLFGLTGGGPASPPAYRLNITLAATNLSVIVDINSGRPDTENYALNASYTLQDIKSGKPVLNSQTFARVSYDIPGQAQRFARARGLRDAEDRAAQLIADNIRARLASFFVAGT
jgi:LPS-assembly lipoprotein